MSLRSIVKTFSIVSLITSSLATAVQAADSADLTPKFEAGRKCYIESLVKVDAKSTSPMGDFDMGLEVHSGMRWEVAQGADGAKITQTIDRSGFVFDSSMGRSFYDSDIPDEEQSEQWEQILAPQIGMAIEIELGSDNKVKSFSGMEAIVEKVESAVTSGNMFWTYEKPRYTDDKQQEVWQNQVLSIFPNRTIKSGETWTSDYLEPLAELKEFAFKTTYKLDAIIEEGGRQVAKISFTGEVGDKDKKYEADAMMPVNNITFEKASLEGNATIDIDRGELIYREDRVELAYSGTMGQGEGGPKTSTQRKITRTITTKSLEERAAEKKANAEIAANKLREAEAAKAERQKRFADAKQVDVETGMRPNPIDTDDAWPQWGGPHGDFKATSTSIADKWPDDGPKQLWKRDLGDGYSSIISDGERLYTMYRPTDEEKNKTDEYVIALDPKTGDTVWEFKYEAPFEEGMDASFGHGPHSTPVIVGDRLFAVSSMVQLHCLDKNTGKVIWTRDLHKDYGAATMMYGYGASPLAYHDLIILPIGGEGQAVVAFKQSDGSEAWKNLDFGPTHASIGVVDVAGSEELILFSAAEVAGLNPENGELYWRIEHPTQWGANISTPVWGADGVLVVSSAYGMGSRGVKLAVRNGEPVATELWYNNKMRIHHENAIRIGNFVYGASGDFGPVFYAAVDVNTGDLAWRSRDIGKSNTIYADGKAIIINEDGKLFLAKLSPAGIEILSQTQQCEGRTWTAPTLVGKTLYVRDRKQIMALDIG